MFLKVKTGGLIGSFVIIMVTEYRDDRIEFHSEVDISDLMTRAIKENASDIHITVGVPPIIRVHGDLKPVKNQPVLKPEDTLDISRSLMSDKQITKFERNREIDFAIGFTGLGRYRVNCFYQKGSVGVVLRLIPTRIPTVGELSLPPICGEMSKLKRGLILFTGPTGSGKSSSLAAILDVVNRSRRCHIMCIEDPVEFVHEHKMSLVNQRELGEDTYSFAEALKHVLRQDPDVILVGEMRDLETISLAITAAETGHLVFATLHTIDTPQTVDRIIDVFPPYQQQQIRYQLSTALKAIFTQQLLQKADMSGRIPAVEILINTPAVANLIREGKQFQIYSVLQTSQKDGMQTMDGAIKELYIRGAITRQEALANVHNMLEFDELLKGANTRA